MIDLNEIIRIINPIKVVGDTNRKISQIVSALSGDVFTKEDLFWISDKNKEILAEIHSGNVICSQLDDFSINPECTYIIVENPRQAFQMVLDNFFARKKPATISQSAKIHPTAKLGKRVRIGENVVIEEDCVIGNDCVIEHNTVIHNNSIIEDFVQIGSNCVIGGVGFGYEKDKKGSYKVIHHIGNVILKKFVEIGNCTCIDRAVLGSTILEENVKVDNLVHIAHGVKIGKNSLIIANSMIGGSSIIESEVWIAPSVSIINKITVQQNSFIGMGAVVIKNVEESAVMVGNPAKRIK
jgi:UDP-3-O-[3-hydroxymyristoyl] glucosamine N-acyltransferase